MRSRNGLEEASDEGMMNRLFGIAATRRILSRDSCEGLIWRDEGKKQTREELEMKVWWVDFLILGVS